MLRLTLGKGWCTMTSRRTGETGRGPARNAVAEAAIDEAFHRAKLGLPLTDHQTRIVQFLSNGFGCRVCTDRDR